MCFSEAMTDIPCGAQWCDTTIDTTYSDNITVPSRLDLLVPRPFWVGRIAITAHMNLGKEPRGIVQLCHTAICWQYSSGLSERVG